MIKKTIMLPHKKLSQVSQEVTLPLSDQDDKIAQNLIFYLQSTDEDNGSRPGIGVAAVQLGFLKRMFLVDFTHQNQREKELLINPKIEAYSKSYVAINSGEGCLSVPEKYHNQEGLVHRRNKIVISGYSYFQKKHVTLTKVGFFAVVYQHEMDHLNGKLFIDRIDQKQPWAQKPDEILIF